MKNTLASLAFASLGALTLAAPVSKAMPLAQPAQKSALQNALFASLCNDKGDCRSSYRATRVQWDENREQGGRYGYRDRDRDEEYERHPGYRDRDEYEERGEDRDRGRYGRGDKDEREERGE